MACRISKGEWVFVAICAGVIDIIQFVIGVSGTILTAIAIGPFIIAVNEASDPFIGAAAAIYFQLRGVSFIKHPSRLVSLLGVIGLEEITGGIAAFWLLDVWYIYRTVQTENATEKQAAEQTLAQTMRNIRTPAVVNGRRGQNAASPSPADKQPPVVNGIRFPNKPAR